MLHVTKLTVIMVWLNGGMMNKARKWCYLSQVKKLAAGMTVLVLQQLGDNQV